MATLESKKLRVLERLVETYNEEVIDKVQHLLDAEKNTYTIPKEHYDLLEEDHQKYLKGELSTSTWEEVEERLKSKYGL